MSHVATSGSAFPFFGSRSRVAFFLAGGWRGGLQGFGVSRVAWWASVRRWQTSTRSAMIAMRLDPALGFRRVRISPLGTDAQHAAMSARPEWPRRQRGRSAGIAPSKPGQGKTGALGGEGLVGRPPFGRGSAEVRGDTEAMDGTGWSGWAFVKRETTRSCDDRLDVRGVARVARRDQGVLLVVLVAAFVPAERQRRRVFANGPAGCRRLASGLRCAARA
jgi:hypothetical protein